MDSKCNEQWVQRYRFIEAKEQLAAALEREKELKGREAELVGLCKELNRDKNNFFNQSCKNLKRAQASEEREKLAMETVELYADKENWRDWRRPQHSDVFVSSGVRAGYEPAQECKRKVEAME